MQDDEPKTTETQMMPECKKKVRSKPESKAWLPGGLGTIAHVCRRSGRGRTFISRQIKEGCLTGRKAGRSTLVHWDDYEAWWQNLPLAGRPSRAEAGPQVRNPSL